MKTMIRFSQSLKCNQIEIFRKRNIINEKIIK